MSTIEEQRARAQDEDARQSRYDAHRAERRTIGARARAEAHLQEAFERDLISLSTLEDRLAVVNKARTEAEIDVALVDVPALAEVEDQAAASSRALAVVGDAPKTGWAVAILGGSTRKGKWRVPAKLRTLATMGGVELDLSQARLGPVTEITCAAIMGGIEIKVPRGARVESNGIGIMGGFEATDDDTGGGPLIRVKGFAFWGGVEVKVADPE